MRMLAPALRRHIAHRAFENLQQSLLHAFAGNVARDADVFRLAPDLVDLVDVDDTHFGAFHVVVGALQKAENDVLHIFADVAGLGDGRGVRNAKGTSRMRARVRASSVLPDPVGPISRTLLFSISTSASGPRCCTVPSAGALS